MSFSDYIVYVDESGDHSLNPINPDYPVFVLAFCILRKDDYLAEVVPRIQELKFKYFGHDMIVLHEIEIRKSRGPFNILLNEKVRDAFLKDLSALITDAPFTLVASCILKRPYVERRGFEANPYHTAMEFGLERVHMELQERIQPGQKTHVVFERRGAKEDDALELEFRRILAQSNTEGLSNHLDIVMAPKQCNSGGLQLADMVARPIGRYLINPEQRNRAYERIRDKFRHSPMGEIGGWGLKVYP